MNSPSDPKYPVSAISLILSKQEPQLVKKSGTLGGLDGGLSGGLSGGQLGGVLGGKLGGGKLGGGLGGGKLGGGGLFRPNEK